MSFPSNSSHSPKPGDSDYGLYHRMIPEDPETIVNIASHLACNEFPPIKLRDGYSHRLNMGMPARRSLHMNFGGQVDLDVNRKRVLTVAYDSYQKQRQATNRNIGHCKSSRTNHWEFS